MVLTFSGQSSTSRSSSSRSEYAVMRIIHCRSRFRNTGKLPRSLRPSEVTSSLASTVPSPGHQFTSESARYTSRYAVDDVRALTRRQLRPRPAIIESPGYRTRIRRSSSAMGLALSAVRIEPGVVDLQEDPLGPLVEVDVGGGEAAAGVVARSPRRPSCRRKLTMFASVRVRGWVPVCTAYCSAGSPNASNPTRATRCGPSSGNSARRHPWRCSRADARRAAPPRTGTGTCPARTSCRRAPGRRRPPPMSRRGWAR